MARQRLPIPIALPFAYWVFGRPVSTRNDEGKTPKALPKWRGIVNAAFAEALETATRGRGAVLVATPVEVRIVWLSLDPRDASQPDIDNILKPPIDAFNQRLIADDRQVHRILAEKASINAPPRLLDDVIGEIQDDDRFAAVGEVIVVRLLDFTREYRP